MKFREIFKLPRSQRLVLTEIFELGRPVTVKDLSRKKLQMAPRTVSYALTKLTKLGLIKKVHNLQDMRMPLYFIPKDRDRWIRRRVGSSLRMFLKV